MNRPTRRVLPRHPDRAHVEHLHLEELLDGALDLVLVRVRVDREASRRSAASRAIVLFSVTSGRWMHVVGVHAGSSSAVAEPRVDARRARRCVEQQVLVAQHVVDVEALGAQHVDAAAGCARRARGCVSAASITISTELRRAPRPASTSTQRLVLGASSASASTTMSAAFAARAARARRAARRAAPSWCSVCVVAARHRAEHDAAARPLRRADRALARAAGALLAPRLRCRRPRRRRGSWSRACRRAARRAGGAPRRGRGARCTGASKTAGSSSTLAGLLAVDVL